MTVESALALFQIQSQDIQPWLDRLRVLYADMDHSYEETAAYYGFVCNGCDDNCCRSLFFHHTIVECLYLIDGFRRLPPTERQDILAQAEAMSGLNLRGTCPLIVSDRCRLYPFRPMICRLHGIPNELRPPGRPPSHHPGCAAFERIHPGPFDRRLDRTPHYTTLARLEQDIRNYLRFHSRIHLTVAQILTTFGDAMDPIDRSTDPVDPPGLPQTHGPFDRRNA